MLGHEQVGFVREHPVQVVARLSRPKRRAWLDRVMAHVDDRLRLGAPGVEQRADVCLAGWVVARSPGGIVHAALQVDHE